MNGKYITSICRIRMCRDIREFLTRHSGKKVTGRLNRLYGDEEQAPGLDTALAKMQSRSLGPAGFVRTRRGPVS